MGLDNTFVIKDQVFYFYFSIDLMSFLLIQNPEVPQQPITWHLCREINKAFTLTHCGRFLEVSLPHLILIPPIFFCFRLSVSPPMAWTLLPPLSYQPHSSHNHCCYKCNSSEFAKNHACENSRERKRDCGLVKCGYTYVFASVCVVVTCRQG